MDRWSFHARHPFIHQSNNPPIRFFPVEIAQLAQVLVALGCPADKSIEMAAQLDKRAHQLAVEKGRSKRSSAPLETTLLINAVFFSQAVTMMTTKGL